MAIAKNPKRNAYEKNSQDEQAAAFIAKAGNSTPEIVSVENRKPTMIRIPPDILERIDTAAKRLGLTRSAFIVLSAAEKLERVE